jgi:zinc transport system permease protein
MQEFISFIFNYSFLRNAIIVSLLASIACGISGSFVVKKKMTFVSGGLAHAILGGIGIAYFLKLNTFIGAIIFALIFSFIITIAKNKAHQEEDTIIGVLWAVGMAIGIIFMYITPGYNVDLLSFIFGNILMVENGDIFLVLTLDIVIFFVFFLLYYHFLYASFDEEFLEVRGLNINLIYFTLLSLISITIVILIKIVGLILVIALLTLPSVIASLFSRTMIKMIIISIFLSIIFTLSGIFLAFQFNLPAGACIIIFAGIIYFFALIFKKLNFIGRVKV